jgi:acetyl esterase/lipase
VTDNGTTAPVSGSKSHKPDMPSHAKSRRAWLIRARNSAVATGMRLGLGVIAAIPDGAKRLVTRSITIDGNTLDPTLQLMLAGQRLTGVESILTGADPVTNRLRLRRQTKVIDRNPVQVRAVADLSIPGPAGSIPARHYFPDNDEVGPLLMFIHGGGWVMGDLDTQDNLCRVICRGAGIHVLSVDYRLAPENPAPAGVEDCYAAYRWALQHGRKMSTRPGVVAVGGDSAGGNLSAVISHLGRDDGVAPALQLLLYPSTDARAETRSRALFANGFFVTEAAMNWFRDHYLGTSQLDPTDPLVSPVLAENLSGLPRALVITAGFDPLRDEGETYAKAMHDAGVVVDLRRMSSLTHGFASNWPLGGASASAMGEIISALRAHLSYL